MKLRLPPYTNDLLHPKYEDEMKNMILLSPVTKYVLPTFLVGALIVAGVYATMLFLVISKDNLAGVCEVPSIYQVNCLPGRKTTYDKCRELGCCYQETTGNCYHTVPSNYGYMRDASNSSVLRATQQMSPLGSENKPITFSTKIIAENHIQIDINVLPPQQIGRLAEKEQVKQLKNSFGFLADRSTQVDHDTWTARKAPEGGISIAVSDSTSQFSITLTHGNKTLMTTSRGPLIITETYWEWSLYLGNSSVYGLNSAELNGTLNWIYNNKGDTVSPSFLGISSDGSGIGCYIEYMGPMEIEVLQSNLIILRGLSMPETLSIHVFTGETPQEVTKQFRVWSLSSKAQTPEVTMSNLGLHICPEKEETLETSSKNVNQIIEHMESRGAPWDSHCIHKNFYLTLDKTLDEDEQSLLQEIRKKLTQKGKTVLHHLSDVCSFGKNDLASKLAEQSLLLENIHAAYRGVSGNETVVYPNWLDERTLGVYDTEIKRYLQSSPTSKFLYLRDLWPRDDSNITTNFSKFDYIPEQLHTLMSIGSLPIDLSSSTAESHYKVHNSYAREFRAFVEKYVNSMEVEMWNEEVSSGWLALRKILNRGIASGAVGQVPSAIYMCSIRSPTDDDLCQRWYGIGVVFPHILAIPQNIPDGDWLSISTSKYVAKLLRLRASLATYQYGILAEYYNSGAPILAPMYFHYPGDKYMKYLESQFMWGESVLVGVVTRPKTMQISLHIPGEQSQPWRHLQGGQEVLPTAGKSISVSILEGEIVTLLRPGHVVPFHETPGLTTLETRRTPVKLICNFACNGGKCHAEGRIFYGRERYLSVAVNNSSLELKNSSNDTATCPDQATIFINSVEILDSKSIYNLNLNISTCRFNETIVNLQFAPP